MGYACPVCETPQQDGEHLANHLAMTAMLHSDEHADWLDDHVDGWSGMTPVELGREVAQHAEEVDYDEAAVEHADIPGDAETHSHDGHGHDHGHGNGHDGHDHGHGNGHDGHDHGHDGHDHGHAQDHGHAHGHGHEHAGGHGHGLAAADVAGMEDVDDETAAILEEARELTRQKLEDAAVEGEADDAESADADDE